MSSNAADSVSGIDSLIRSVEHERAARLRRLMRDQGIGFLLTADPINIVYATGVRNMTIFSMMGASRFLLFSAEGPTVLWEFPGAEHLAADRVDEVRTAPGVTATAGPGYLDAIRAFAAEVSDCCEGETELAVERCDHPITDALRSQGLSLLSATETFVEARMLKTLNEINLMGEAMRRVEAGVVSMRSHLEPGRTENEVWAELHRHLIATDGEYISTRLAQSGPRTFPYFQEAGNRVIGNGDLFCLDTDAIGVGGYGVDFSRTFRCGDGPPSSGQARVHSLALEQLQVNSALLEPGRSFEDFSRSAWRVPERHAPFGYHCIAHGLGMSGEYPYVPAAQPGAPYEFDGEFQPGMVICVESYIGDPDLHIGAKLEDQFLITQSGAVLMSVLPHGLDE
jgi:Xaa-Pro dipeptidase